MNLEEAEKIVEELKQIIGERAEIKIENGDYAKIVIANITLNRGGVENLMDYIHKKNLQLNFKEDSIEII
ncbi:MAG: hypothetical protein ACP6IU_14730 [Candidatus Asgardarchaeia archaeon]